ncbi:MAG TPA: protein-disulfide reductase DsbD family protein [Chakrabartia sp.]|nr:protein-disulfide reductase DsbD family protein [Chakrabartia sp.]
MKPGKPKLLLAALLGLLTILLGSPAVAQEAHIKAELIAEGPVAPGGSTMLAIRFVPDAGWHGYWKNPGDAGQPATFEWTKPATLTLDAPRFPVPEKLVIAGLMNHVYNGEHVLLLRLSASADVPMGAVLPVSVKANWLACTNSICVPESGTLQTRITVGQSAPDAASRTRFDGWRAQLPQPLEQPGMVERVGDTIRLAIPYPAGAAVDRPWFYAETAELVNYAAPQTTTRSGDWLVVEAKAASVPFNGQPVSGLLMTSPGRGLEFTAKPGAVPQGDAPEGQGMQALIAFAGALLGGLLLNILPCVFPIISLKALSLVRSGESEAAARREALAYTAGVVLTCLALGGLLLGLRSAGVAVGWAFQLQNPWIVALLLVLAVAITANLAGWFTLPGFGGGEQLAQQDGVKGAFWTGALAAFVATPCTGPFMAAALGAALVLPVPAALLIFAGLGLGMALPFLSIGYVPALRSRLPRPGAWMETFRRFLAIPMGLTALALAWLLAGQTGLAKEIPFLAPAASQHTPFSEAKLAALRGEGKPVFLYFTADWCLTCKVNEKTAIETDAVRSAFRKKGVVVMVGDWTRSDPAITRFLEAKGRSGVPLYLWYAPGKEAQELPQLLTPAMLAALE